LFDTSQRENARTWIGFGPYGEGMWGEEGPGEEVRGCDAMGLT
jgi:hypothetical protein